MYPDILNYDKVVEVTGSFKTPMGCRSFLNPYEENGELFPAIEILEQLVEAEPGNRDYQLKLAVSCIDTGQVERAEPLLRACLEAGLDDPQMQLNLGHALKALGKTDEAVECYMGVAHNDDDSMSAIGYWSLGNMKNYKFDDMVLTRLRDRVQQSELGSPFRGLMLFALAAGSLVRVKR